MKNILAWAIIAIIPLLMINGITSLSIQEIPNNIPMMNCMDYDFHANFMNGELPVEMKFYTIENGEEEFFKRDISKERFKSTLLHCGHDYNAIYTFADGKVVTDSFIIPEYNPLIDKIWVVKI